MIRLNLVRIADSVGAFEHLVPGDTNSNSGTVAGNGSILQPSEFVIFVVQDIENSSPIPQFNAAVPADNFGFCPLSAHDQQTLCGISLLILRLTSATLSPGVSLS
jgi:hypothetical protein